jgi:hypothetical protein
MCGSIALERVNIMRWQLTSTNIGVLKLFNCHVVCHNPYIILIFEISTIEIVLHLSHASSSVTIPSPCNRFAEVLQVFEATCRWISWGENQLQLNANP